MKIIYSCIAANLALAVALSPSVAQEIAQEKTELKPQIDYRGFSNLTAEVENYRAGRLVDLDTFHRIAERGNAIILDTRSRSAFENGHIEGAINLPFSDFTEEKLAEILSDKSRPILIYCNNNFTDNRFPIALKSAPLALNIPTFINLYGYGYKNIYELGDVLSIKNEKLQWIGSGPFGLSNAKALNPPTADDAPSS